MNLRRSGPWFGLAGMIVALSFYALVGLVAPWWVVPLMLLLWGVMLTVLVRSWTPRPLLALVMPFIALAVWFGVVVAGGAWLGWTA